MRKETGLSRVSVTIPDMTWEQRNPIPSIPAPHHPCSRVSSQTGPGSSGKGRDGAWILPALPLRGLPGHRPHRKALRQEEGRFLLQVLGSWLSRRSSAASGTLAAGSRALSPHPHGGGGGSSRRVWLCLGILAPGLETHESQDVRADQGTRHSLNLLGSWHQSWQQGTEEGRSLTLGQERQPVQKLRFGVN